jgi:hypothetical protein
MLGAAHLSVARVRSHRPVRVAVMVIAPSIKELLRVGHFILKLHANGVRWREMPLAR